VPDGGNPGRLRARRLPWTLLEGYHAIQKFSSTDRRRPGAEENQCLILVRSTWKCPRPMSLWLTNKRTHKGWGLRNSRSLKSVILITYHFPPEIGGIHTRMLHYVENLRSRGISVTVFFVVSHGTEMKRYLISGADVSSSLAGRASFQDRIQSIENLDLQTPPM